MRVFITLCGWCEWWIDWRRIRDKVHVHQTTNHTRWRWLIIKMQYGHEITFYEQTKARKMDWKKERYGFCVWKEGEVKTAISSFHWHRIIWTIVLITREIHVYSSIAYVSAYSDFIQNRIEQQRTRGRAKDANILWF